MKKNIWKLGLVIVFIIAIVMIGIRLYFAQWSVTGYSRMIGIEIDGKQELKKLANDGEYEIYTYNLESCKVSYVLSGKSYSLQDIMPKEISLNDLTGTLKETKTDDFDIYEAENYKIYVIKDRAVITSNDIEESQIINAIGY